MHVVYKKTIVEKLDMAVSEAASLNKQIEKFQLTKEEWNELLDIYYRPYGMPLYDYLYYLKSNPEMFVLFKGIPVECAE